VIGAAVVSAKLLRLGDQRMVGCRRSGG
jgi:hypothetical protein